ncbi:hypothetical protein D3C72_1539600 [compost metagenome]
MPVVSPRKPVSTSRPSPGPARMAASSRPTWKRLPLPVVRRQLLPPQHPQAHRLRHLPRVRPTKPFSSCSSRVPTSWCRMTACARSLPSVWSNPSRPFRISTFPWIANWIRFWRCAPSSMLQHPKRTASPPTSFRSTTWSSRRWLSRCATCLMPTSPGRKATWSSTSIRMSASPFPFRVA